MRLYEELTERIPFAHRDRPLFNAFVALRVMPSYQLIEHLLTFNDLPVADHDARTDRFGNPFDQVDQRVHVIDVRPCDHTACVEKLPEAAQLGGFRFAVAFRARMLEFIHHNDERFSIEMFFQPAEEKVHPIMRMAFAGIEPERDLFHAKLSYQGPHQAALARPCHSPQPDRTRPLLRSGEEMPRSEGIQKPLDLLLDPEMILTQFILDRLEDDGPIRVIGNVGRQHLPKMWWRQRHHMSLWISKLAFHMFVKWQTSKNN